MAASTRCSTSPPDSTRAPWRMPLPPTLRWIDADLPGILDYKTEMLRDEKPVCQYEAVRIDLHDAAKREALFAQISAQASRVLVVTEGLLVYLTAGRGGVARRAICTRRRTSAGGCSIWRTRSCSRSWSARGGRACRRGTRRSCSRPPKARSSSEPFGWRERSSARRWRKPRRLKREMRMMWLWRMLGSFSSAKRKREMKRMSGIVLLERMSALGPWSCSVVGGLTALECRAGLESVAPNRLGFYLGHGLDGNWADEALARSGWRTGLQPPPPQSNCFLLSPLFSANSADSAAPLVWPCCARGPRRATASPNPKGCGLRGGRGEQRIENQNAWGVAIGAQRAKRSPSSASSARVRQVRVPETIQPDSARRTRPAQRPRTTDHGPRTFTVRTCASRGPRRRRAALLSGWQTSRGRGMAAGRLRSRRADSHSRLPPPWPT